MKRTPFIGTIAGLLIVGGMIIADRSKEAAGKPAHDHEHAAPEVKHGVVVLAATEGNDVKGWLTLTAVKGGVELAGKVSNLTPGKHGFHVHEFGDLREPAGKAAGGHFNPEGHDHGGLHSEERHAGDLGNIEADESGNAEVKVLAPGLVLSEVLGRSIVVHAGEDDLTSQPSGDSGDRIAVGVIGIAQPPKENK